MRSFVQALLFGTVSGVALAGCAAVKPAESPVVMRLSPATQAVTGVPVAVAPVTARGALAERRYAYVDRAAPSELRQAATFFWEEPPPVALGRALVDALRPGAGSPAPTRRLATTLLDFQELTGGGTAEAVVGFDALVTDGADRRRLFSARYCARTPITGASGTERARAFETALTQAAGHAAQDAAAGAASASTGC